MLIFDIGSHMFDFTEKCIHKYPNCKVVAVDVLTPALALKGKLKKLEDSVIFLNKAVSDSDGELKKIYVNQTEPGMTTASEYFKENSRFVKGNSQILENYASQATIYALDKYGVKKPITNPPVSLFSKALIAQHGSIENFLKKQVIYQTTYAETITLDTMIQEYGEPDLIKIDVEGYENVVLAGLSAKTNKVCFEWAEEVDYVLHESLNRLEKLGYKEFSIRGRFEDENKYEFLIYDDEGDTHLKEPLQYHSIEEIKSELDAAIEPQRKISWGMCWAK